MRISLQGLEHLVRHLAAMPGQRALVMVSPGFLTFTEETIMARIIDRALRSGVIIDALDARGLDVGFRPGDSGEMPIDIGPEMLARKTRLVNEGISLKTDVLADLAGSTGGNFFHNNNDLDLGFRSAVALPEVTYLLSFSPTDLKPNGRFHALNVKLASRGSYIIEARRGYFAPKNAGEMRSQTDDRLENVIFSEQQLNGLPVEVRTEVAKLDDHHAMLSVLIRVNVGLLRFHNENGRNVNKLTFDTVVFNRDGKYVAGNERSLEFHMKDETLAKFSQEGITAKTFLKVPSGSYTVREVVRDAEAGEMSAWSRAVDIPY